MTEPVKILGDITDVMINNFGMATASSAPGNPVYDKLFARLVSQGGDELKGVSDPLEKIFSAVSRHIEEYGMTPAMQNEHARISEAMGDGRKISRFNESYHQARDYGEVLRGADTSSAVSAKPTSRLRGTLTGETAVKSEATNKMMKVEDFIRMTRERGSELSESINSLQGSGPAHYKTSVGDILGEYAGFSGAPIKTTDQEIDKLVASGSHYEVLRGSRKGSFNESFMTGTSGYSAYDEGGTGHYFSVEALDDEIELKKFEPKGVTLDKHPTFQAVGFGRSADPAEKTIIRGAFPKDANISTLGDLANEALSLQEDPTVGSGQLRAFREELLNSGDSKALGTFDAMFDTSIDIDKRAGFAGIITGTDAYTTIATYKDSEGKLATSSGGNELVILNREAIHAADPKTLADHQAMYPSEKKNPGVRSSMAASHNEVATYKERMEMLRKRVADAETAAKPKYSNTTEMVDDFIKTSREGFVFTPAERAGGILKDVFDKTDFANKEFNIPGSTKTVTGSDVLAKLSGIEINNSMGSVAAYNPESGKMLINTALMGSLQPEEIATTFTHEMFHTAAHASGSLDPERLTRATTAGGAMSVEDAKYIGQQEGIADSFSRRITKRSWLHAWT